MDKQQLVIRKKTSLGARLRRLVLLVVLWAIALGVLTVNVCFMLGIYTDALVVNYALFNLSFRMYKVLGLTIVLIGGLVAVYGVWHLRRLKRKAVQHDQN
ncbi:hypothetical protein [Secundilactobacillus muriivasis]